MTVASGPGVLRRTLAVGLLVVGGCSSDDNTTGDCSITHETKTITTPDPSEDPGLQFKIQSCRVDANACPRLCALAMQQAGIDISGGGQFNGTEVPTPGGTISTPVNPAVACDVLFKNGNVEMTVQYDVYTSTNGCPVFVDEGGVAPTTGGTK